MKTARFKIREDALKNIFDKKNVISVWRSIVKNQLRSLDIKDIFDYYDFNYSIEDRALVIRNEILNGTYKTQSPLIFKVEKKLGICRHLMVPQPTDALIMQTITEAIYPKIKDEQPSLNAFYSRDRHTISKPHEVTDSEYENNWRKQWKKKKKKIYNFNNCKELLIVTDLTNYFDSIDLSTLREFILNITDNDCEVLIDLLFRMIEEISWKPDYLPYKKYGLPTVNIESIRLLGHSFLFEVDKVLKNKTKNNFARWMDDITIGVNDKKEAVQILSSVSDVLKSRGLALNLSKTSLYSAKDFKYNFLISSNKFLDRFESIESPSSEDKRCLRKEFKKHLKDRNPQHWSKVTKRFITSFGRQKIKIFKDVKDLYIDYPALRGCLAIYLTRIGYSKESARALLYIFSKLDIHDDVSLFYLCRVMTTWFIPTNKDGILFVNDVCGTIGNIGRPLQFYSLMWIKSKYDHPESLLDFIENYKNVWHKNFFLRRQVTSILSRLLINNENKVLKLLNDQIHSGAVDAISVANLIIRFSSLEKLDKKLKFYLFPNNLSYYTLERFLVLCSVLNSKEIRRDKDVIKNVKKHIKDPYFRKWLDFNYNIN